MSCNYSTIRLFPGSFIAALLLFCPALAQAAAYLLFPTTASVARALAGNGLLEHETSGLLFNPASPGIQQEAAQLELGLSYIAHDGSMQNQGSYLTRVVDGNAINVPIAGPNGTADATVAIPYLFYTRHLSEHPRFSWGAGFSVPYGLDTEYNAQWAGRYQALRSSLEIMEFDLVLAYQLNPRWHVGAGVSVQHATVELTQAIPLSPVQDGLLAVAGKSKQQGFTAGLIYQPQPSLKLGLSYRSRMAHDFGGTQNITLSSAMLSHSSVQAPLTVPEMTIASLRYAPPEARWGFAAALRHTRWERFAALELNYPDGSSKVLPQRWHNSFTYSIALDYSISANQQVILGYADDRSPVPNEQLRIARIPDANRKIVGLGYEIKNVFCQSCSVMLAYHRTMAGSRTINRSEDFRPGFSNTLRGKFPATNADVAALSFHKSFE